MNAKTYCLMLLIFTTLFAAVVFAANIFVDPQGALRYLSLKGVNHYIVRNNSLGRVGNGLNLYLNEYDILLLGTYRVQLGMNPRMAPFSGERVYNASLGGTEIYEIVAEMEFILAHQPDLKEIYLGLDLHTFSANRPLHRGYESSLFNPETRFTPYLFKTYFSKGAISDSLSTISANIRGTPETYWMDGHLHKGSHVNHRAETEKLLTNYMSSKVMFGCFEYSFAKRDALLSVLEKYAVKGIELNLFISPQHAKSLLVLEQVDSMETYFDWLRDMANMADSIDQKYPGSLKLWNFSGFNSVTTEPIVEGSGKMKFYYEASHYNDIVGQRIVEVMRSSQPQEDFGTPMSSDNIEVIIDSMKEAALSYKQLNPSEMAELTSVYDETQQARQSSTCLSSR